MGDGFAWTIPLIQLCFGVLFVAARRMGAAREAGVWASAYSLNAAAFTVSMLDQLLPGKIVAVGTDVLFALSFYRFGEALVVRYNLPPARMARLMLLAVALAAPIAGVLVADSIPLELLGSDIGCAAQITLPLVLLRRWPKGGLDQPMLGLSWLVVVANLCRAMSAPLTAADATFASFVDTAYSYLMYADGMLTGLAFGVLALIAVTSDMVACYRRDADADPLTGLLNRRGLEASGGRVDQAGYAGVIACDLDHFKRVNDTYGHAVGDSVLVAVAELIRSVLPAGAVAARVGGEEFVLHLPGCDMAQSRAVAAQLSTAMEKYNWSAAGLHWQQSASVGLSERSGTTTLVDAIRIADAFLYEAKRHGRNRIHGRLAA